MQLSAEKQRKLDRLARLKPMVAGSKRGSPSDAAVRHSLSALGRALRRSGETASIRFRLVAGRRELIRTVVFSSGRAEVAADVPGRPNLEVTLSRDDWWAIARGDLSPAAVFLMGRLRLRGDCALARRFYRHLAGPTGSADVLA